MISIKTKGYLAGATAAISYGLNPLFALPLYAAGMNTDSVLCYRYGIATIILGVLMALTRKSFRLTRRQFPQMCLFGVLFALSSLLLFESYRYMDVGIASTILFVYPVFVAVINAVFYRERVSPLTILSIVLALVGISLLYSGDGTSTLSITGTVLVLASSLSYAIYIVAVNRSSIRHLPSTTVTFYAILLGQSVFIVRMIAWSGLSPIESGLSTVCVIGLALFPTIISLVTLAISIRCIGSTPAAILGALEPVSALVVGICVFGERLTLTAVFGIILVLMAVTLLVAAKPLMRVLRQSIVRIRLPR
jgi:drug/metabolite transporter (DMT)-like permease